MAPVRTSFELEPGQEIAGKYRLEKEIGKGAMGVVYQAEHLVLNERVALKFIQKFEDEGRQERFLREARTGARLRSEHTVRVLDVGSLAHGQHFLVMELLSGHNLRDELGARGPLPVAEAVDHIIQACEALAEAHLLGIVHRDLKPANLFLTARADGSPLLKVLDFGVAKHSALESDELTASDDLVGSPAYMSPEQLRSSRQATPAADIWSLGVVLYELLVGHRPFSGETTADLILAICTGKPAPPHKVRPEIPEALGRVILSCLQRNPAGRPATVAALAGRLLPFSSLSYAKVVVERLQKLDFSSQPRPSEPRLQTPPARSQADSSHAATDTSSQDERTLEAVSSWRGARRASPPPALDAPAAPLPLPGSPLRRAAPWLALVGALPLAWLALSPTPASPGATVQSPGSATASVTAASATAASVLVAVTPGASAAASSAPTPPPAASALEKSAPGPAPAGKATRATPTRPPARVEARPAPGGGEDELFVPSSRK